MDVKTKVELWHGSTMVGTVYFVPSVGEQVVVKSCGEDGSVAENSVYRVVSRAWYVHLAREGRYALHQTLRLSVIPVPPATAPGVRGGS